MYSILKQDLYNSAGMCVKVQEIEAIIQAEGNGVLN